MLESPGRSRAMASITSQHVCMTLLEILGVIRENVSRWYRICLPIRETQETQVRSLGREDPLRRKWQPTPVFWPGKFHGQRSLVGFCPCGHKALDTTERLSTHTSVKMAYRLFLPVGGAELGSATLALQSCLLHRHRDEVASRLYLPTYLPAYLCIPMHACIPMYASIPCGPVPRMTRDWPAPSPTCPGGPALSTCRSRSIMSTLGTPPSLPLWAAGQSSCCLRVSLSKQRP